MESAGKGYERQEQKNETYTKYEVYLHKVELDERQIKAVMYVKENTFPMPINNTSKHLHLKSGFVQPCFIHHPFA